MIPVGHSTPWPTSATCRREKDPALKKIADGGCTKIAACYPRAVTWLFHAAGTPLPDEGIEVLNMREDSAEQIVTELLA